MIPKPFTAEKWAALVKSKLAPFLKKSFPGKESFTILLDGEQLLHAPAAKAAMAEKGISVLSGWPKYSPDINPQENVWHWAEKELRRIEKKGDSFATFETKVIKACNAYPSSDKLVGSMAKRMQELVEAKGAMLDR